MTLLLAVTVAVLFGAGALLVLERDLVRMAAGTLLMSQSANLFLMGAALMRGAAPVLPVESPSGVSDPLVQALTLTAVVISFGVTALLLALVLRVSLTHDTIEVEEVVRVEERKEQREEAGEDEETGRVVEDGAAAREASEPRAPAARGDAAARGGGP